MWARLRTFWRAACRRQDWEAGIDEELQFHAEQRAEQLIVSGVSPAEARRQARLELGATEHYKEICREAYGLRWLDELVQDTRYAIRVLLRSPGFALVAIVSLALGIGANTVVFSVLNALILRPLPVEAPAKLFFVQANNYATHSYPNYLDMRDGNTSFSALVAYRIASMGLDGGDSARMIWGYLVSGNYFKALGVKPALGRFFGPEEDRKPGAEPWAVLSYGCWQNRFGGDPSIVGRTIRINSMPYTVLGVAPREFRGTETFYDAEIWVPMMMQPQVEGWSWLEARSTFNSFVIGRVKPDTSRHEAERDLNAIATALSNDYPESNEEMSVTLVQPGLIGDEGRKPVMAFSAGVMGLAALVLLAACANLASLLSARAADRHRELAIRVSIGAGPARIARQMLTESVLVSIVGGAAGFALAIGLLRQLTRYRAHPDLPVQFDVNPDGQVFLFAVGAVLLTGLLFGMAPARQAWKADPNRELRGTPSARRGARRWALRDGLLVAQVALCCVLVTASLVSLRGLSRAVETPLGFEPDGVAMAAADLNLASYSTQQGREFQRRALEAVSGMPGVSHAAFASALPLSTDHSTTTVFREDAIEFHLPKGIKAEDYRISPGYFAVMGTRLIAGRDLTWLDDADHPAVAIVNQTFSRQVTGQNDGTGERFRLGRQGSAIEIVAVVEDGKYTSVTEDPKPAMFRPVMQAYNSSTVLIARSTIPAGQMAARMRQIIAELDPQIPVHGVGSLRQMLGFVFLPARAATIALGAFGVLAVMLALTGISGLAAYSVSGRVREIGVRVAVGARPSQVLQFVLGRTAILLAVGSLAGLALGTAGGELLASIVYQATPRDPIVVGAAALTMTLIGLAAAWMPARRALSVDPMRSLRQE